MPTTALPLFLVLSSSLALAHSVQSGDTALPKAETILAKLEAATGDAAARARVANIVMTGTMSIAGMPGEGRVEEVYVGRDRVKQTIRWGEAYGSTMGSTGAYSWSTDPAMGVTIKEGDEQGSVKRLFGISRRAAWDTLYARAELIGKGEHEKRPHWEIRMFPKSGKPETWFVDCATHVLARVDLALPNPQGGEIPMQFHYAEFKPVNGVLYPHVKKQVVGELAIVSTYGSIAHPAQVDEALVAPPDDVAKAFADPKKRATVPPEDPNECKVETIEANPCATIRVTIAASDVSKTLATILPEIGAHLAKSGASMTGPPFTRYHSFGGDTLDIEAGMTVAKAIEPAGRILAAQLPGGRTATTWHVGPYHELAQSHRRLEAWMKVQKLAPRAAPWEIYWTDPGIEPDPSKWRTQILWPVE